MIGYLPQQRNVSMHQSLFSKDRFLYQNAIVDWLIINISPIDSYELKYNTTPSCSNIHFVVDPFDHAIHTDNFYNDTDQLGCDSTTKINIILPFLPLNILNIFDSVFSMVLRSYRFFNTESYHQYGLMLKINT